MLTSIAYGQSQIAGAILNGTVSDPSGAVVAGAKVTIIENATGFTRSAETISAGIYSFTSIPPGTYDVEVEKQGFKTAKLTAASLPVGSVATLEIGRAHV